MKILVAYSSITGNTKKVANTVSEALNADLKNILTDEIDVLNYEIIIVGCWIRKASADGKAKSFIDKIHNKKVAYFFTSGAYPDSEYVEERCIPNINELFTKNNNTILGHFNCQGAISKDVQNRILALGENTKHTPNEARLKRWKIAETHPNELDLSNAKTYFTELLEETK